MKDFKTIFRQAFRTASFGAVGMMLTSFGVSLYLYLKLIKFTERIAGQEGVISKCSYDCGAPTSILEIIFATTLLSGALLLVLTIISSIAYFALNRIKLLMNHRLINYTIYLFSSYFGVKIIDDAFLYYTEHNHKLIIYLSSVITAALLALIHNMITKQKHDR